MSSYRIALLPGDGIGPEVTAEAVKILDVVGRKFGHDFSYSEATVGGAAIDVYGAALRPQDLAMCKRQHAVLFGAVGGPQWDDPRAQVRPEQAILGLRKGLRLFANIRPVKMFGFLANNTTLKRAVVKDVDMIILRELTGGIYFGKPQRRWSDSRGRKAVDTLRYSEQEIARIVRLAFELARGRRKHVTSVDKANVLDSSRLWREVATEVAASYPDVTLRHLLVDAAAMHLIRQPAEFDVVVTENLFGDILTDEASMLGGSMGMLPSASLGRRRKDGTGPRPLRAHSRHRARHRRLRQGQSGRRHPQRRPDAAPLPRPGRGGRRRRARRGESVARRPPPPGPRPAGQAPPQDAPPGRLHRRRDLAARPPRRYERGEEAAVEKMMGTRRSDAANVYKAAEEWVERALRSDDSLFTPGKPIWTRQWLGELHERFLNRPDESSDKFLAKLERQLANSPPEVYQLMAEALYVYFLITDTTGSNKKQENIKTVLGWSQHVVSIPSDLVDGLTPGIAGTGQAFNNFRPFQVGSIIEFAEQWKQQPSSSQGRLLDDPWAFKEFLVAIKFRSLLLRDSQKKASAQRQALLHLVFPDTFEAIVSFEHKTKIAKAFAHLVQDPSENDVDRKLGTIRRALAAEYGTSVHLFYEPNIRERWGDQYKPEERVSLPPIEFPEAGEEKPSATDLAQLAKEVHLPIDFLKEIKVLLDEKRQVIFQGPPGTGKTFIARKLARCLAGSEERVKLVQFHPSYAYEDFVQGFRPATARNGQPGFELKGGPLLEAAERARQEPQEKHFLVIDEINRGNLAKVFGELYFLLEYRDSEIRLQYSDALFSLPDNLYIIGTMNTADRSIALVDLALRRRFYFVDFHPDKPPVQGLLRRWLKKNAVPEMEWVADIVDHANGLLSDDRHAAIGPSYFMKPGGLSEADVARVWEHSVLPYVEERLFGNAERLEAFRLDIVRKQAAHGLELDDGEDQAPSEGSDAQ